MIDLTKITTPFGLLDKETQEALKAHGGPYECFGVSGGIGWWNGDQWGNNLEAFPALAWRVKPTPPKPREWWAVGQHLSDTKEEAEAFLAQLREEYVGNFKDWRAIHVREVIE